MHPKDDLLRAFYDQELPGSQSQQVREHLLHCPSCQSRLDQVTLQARRVQGKLDSLAPGAFAQPRSTQAAYRRFANPYRMNTPKKETFKTMFTRRPLWTALAVIALVVMVFTLTPARAWASDFLGLFRVEKVQVFTFDPGAVEANRSALEANQDAFERVFQEDLKMTEHGSPVEIASASEAADKIGFTPRLPAELADAKLTIQPGLNAVFTIDRAKLQELIDLVGVDLQLPEVVDGQEVTLDVPDALEARSGCTEAEDSTYNCLAMIQLHSPVVNAPDGMPVDKMGEAMFTFLGLPPDQAREMSQHIDWSTTLVIPVPRDGDVQVKDVSVDGVTGSLFIEPEKHGFMLIWVKDGILYSLRGPGGEADALEAAASMQ